MNRIKIDPERVTGIIDRNIFGGFAEHLGRCIYGVYYSPNPIAYEACDRTNPLSFLEGIKNKRSSYYLQSLLYTSKYVFSLKPNSNINEHSSQYDISPNNLKLTYLLLDLPPPSNRA